MRCVRVLEGRVLHLDVQKAKDIERLCESLTARVWCETRGTEKKQGAPMPKNAAKKLREPREGLGCYTRPVNGLPGATQ